MVLQNNINIIVLFHGIEYYYEINNISFCETMHCIYDLINNYYSKIC